jgi:pyruvate-ferredoxin/flavodoxin oxidoreductase
MVCPHACIRAKEYDASVLKKAPVSFLTANLRGKNAAKNKRFTLQVYAEDCTGCKLCVDACPVKKKALQMQSKQGRLEIERRNVEFFDSLSYKKPAEVNTATINGIQYLRPFFEFSGACAGCGETPYVKLISQLFGDRMIIGNACGCSSVYGGNLPTSPWVIDENGYGPAWSSSLFEDNAEFAFGFQLAEDKQTQYAEELLRVLDYKIGYDLVQEITDAPQGTAAEINAQRARIDKLKAILAELDDPLAAHLASVADYFVKHSIWAIGGDGWAYDIGFGGLDHVIASKRNVNLLVLDTEVYSNTGGQASKASSRGSVAKFTYAGKETAKKDLGIMAMSYNTAYVCSIALGADPAHAIKAIKEAEAYNGPALILAYSHCVAHGIDMSKGIQHQMLAVKTGYWPLYRYDPRRIQKGLNPLQIDSAKPSIPFTEFAQLENRYRILKKTNPEDMQQLIQAAQQDINRRWERLERMTE